MGLLYNLSFDRVKQKTTVRFFWYFNANIKRRSVSIGSADMVRGTNWLSWLARGRTLPRKGLTTTSRGRGPVQEKSHLNPDPAHPLDSLPHPEVRQSCLEGQRGAEGGLRASEGRGGCNPFRSCSGKGPYPVCGKDKLHGPPWRPMRRWSQVQARWLA